MVQHLASVAGVEEVAQGIYLLGFFSPAIAQKALPGQFVNVRVSDGLFPLLRRPFSICHIDGNKIELVFNIVGEGTRILASKKPGDPLDVLGPLGKAFSSEDSFTTAVIVAGGLGVAPFPFLTRRLDRAGKSLQTFIGASTASKLWCEGLKNIHIATDDGTQGFHGTVVKNLEIYLQKNGRAGTKIFGCGPTKMLKALSDVAKRLQIDCELSLEGDMACGVGICQGCPVERANGKKKYALVCTDGPTFNSKDVVLA